MTDTFFLIDSNLEQLCNFNLMLGDGIFYSSPGSFAKLCSSNGEVNGTLVSFDYALLSNKSQQTHLKSLRLIFEAVHQRNLVLSPEMMVMDCVHYSMKSGCSESTMKGYFS